MAKKKVTITQEQAERIENEIYEAAKRSSATNTSHLARVRTELEVTGIPRRRVEGIVRAVLELQAGLCDLHREVDSFNVVAVADAIALTKERLAAAFSVRRARPLRRQVFVLGRRAYMANVRRPYIWDVSF